LPADELLTWNRPLRLSPLSPLQSGIEVLLLEQVSSHCQVPAGRAVRMRNAVLSRVCPLAARPYQKPND